MPEVACQLDGVAARANATKLKYRLPNADMVRTIPMQGLFINRWLAASQITGQLRGGMTKGVVHSRSNGVIKII